MHTLKWLLVYNIPTLINCSLFRQSRDTSVQTRHFFRSSWPLPSVHRSMGFTAQPSAEEMDPYYVPTRPWVDIRNLSQWAQRICTQPGWAPVNMAKQWCNHQTWVRDMLGFCVYISKCVPQKNWDDEKKNRIDGLQVKGQISLTVISHWLVTVTRSKYTFSLVFIIHNETPIRLQIS